MDLKVKDVAELLNISEKVVERWIAEGNIPVYRLEDEFRFSRAEIEDWLIQHKLDEQLDQEEHPQQGNMQFALYRAIYRGDVLDGVEGKTKEEIVRATMEEMAQRFDLDASVLADLFLDREQMMSTALGHGIAIPHTRDFLLDTHFDVLMTVYPKEPIPFDALDGEPVHTLFFLFACDDRHHLNLLAKLAHLNVSEKNRAFFKQRPSKNHLLDHIKAWESDLSHS